MSPPILILAPGAWHTPEAFGKIIPKLEAKGFKCRGISFPSVMQSPPVQDMSADISAVRDAVLEELDAGNDVAVVSHSWSGIPVSSALEGLGKKARGSDGKDSGVVKIIYISAFVLPIGVSMFDALNRQVPKIWNIDGDIVHANNPIAAFYNDVEPSEAEHYASLLKLHAKATKYTKTTAAAWQEIPSTYLICEEDRAILLFEQETMVKACQDAGADMKSERINSSHSPFLSKPDEVVDFIVREAS